MLDRATLLSNIDKNCHAILWLTTDAPDPLSESYFVINYLSDNVLANHLNQTSYQENSISCLQATSFGQPLHIVHLQENQFDLKKIESVLQIFSAGSDLTWYLINETSKKSRDIENSIKLSIKSLTLSD